MARKGILWAVLQNPLHIEKKFPNGKPHHVTLVYGIERSAFRHHEGRQIKVHVWTEIANDRVQTLLVQLPYGTPCEKKHPHITVSWADGATPNESNALAEAKELSLDTISHNGHYDPIAVLATIEWQPFKPRWQLWLSDLYKQIWRH